MAATAIGARVNQPARFWASTNGQKVVMAVTGVILYLFVIAHLLGNLQIYAGPELLWSARIILILSVLLHIWAAVMLATRKIQARPIGYAQKRNVASTYASRTMYWSGPILLAFVI